MRSQRLPHSISLFSAIDDEANIIRDVLKGHLNWRKILKYIRRIYFLPIGTPLASKHTKSVFYYLYVV